MNIEELKQQQHVIELEISSKQQELDDIQKKIEEYENSAFVKCQPNTEYALRTLIADNQKYRPAYTDGKTIAAYLKQHGTVRLQTGRATGQTTSIQNIASNDDIIIVTDASLENHKSIWYGRLRTYASMIVHSYEHPQIIFVDNASKYSSDELELIYRMFGRSKKQTFVLVG